ncbi:hypothetical protein NBH19_08155 [Rhizobium sp. S95]|uniref:Uncharacterized protein n=1 Tax=Ciceribacter sichuanensis TaxID=2949647 RepID=A0AAJ1C159_9HYPH|nr:MULTISPECIES: hypothetical protein [unclassified Ciceribacter]MCM2396051.1 hypothetical protein [Ciceribacter sp. S95]MCO5959908.1 hypothetical protein [Ciceribacter sp. S101]
MFERRVGLGVGVIIVFFVMYLVIRDRPFDPSLFLLVRIILSFAIGALVATVPGFLGVTLNGPGIAIRAGGGIAAFALTFFFSPGTITSLQPPAGQLSMDPLKVIDFRTLADPGKTEEERRASQMAVTFPVVFRNSVDPAKTVTVEATDVEFTFGGEVYSYHWRDFVKMHEENFGKWLGKEDDAAPFALPAGQVIYKEILHVPKSAEIATWGTFIDAVNRIKPKEIEVTFEADSNSGTIRSVCRAQMAARVKEIGDFIATSKTIPGRITTLCGVL